MSEVRFEVTGNNKAELDREAKATIARFTGKLAEPDNITMSVRPFTVRMDSNSPDSWEATVHYEW